MHKRIVVAAQRVSVWHWTCYHVKAAVREVDDNAKETTMQAYSNPKRANDPHSLPDVEVFQMTAAEIAATMEDEIHEFMKRPEFRLATMNSRDRDRMLDAMVTELEIEGGWMWWSCFPGCLPDSDPCGPFATEAEALADAQGNVDDSDAE